MRIKPAKASTPDSRRGAGRLRPMGEGCPWLGSVSDGIFFWQRAKTSPAIRPALNQ
ncbi:MAG: hypothetical protein JXA42_07480 [Anaerolineales bacterium]|nr:hypothetical protein [Anaerolineales bacterium]